MFKITTSKKGFTLVEIMIVVAIIGILVAIAVPGFINARSQSRAKACMENQEKFDGAKQEWALENNKAATVSSTDADLIGTTLYMTRTPKCPETGTVYAHGTVSSLTPCPTAVVSHLRPN